MLYLQSSVTKEMARITNAPFTDVSTLTEISGTLPCDIITDIFTRLPVKYLAQFKCVSKSMYALLSSHMFVKLHLHRAAAERDPQLILKLDSKLFLVADEEWSSARRLQLPFSATLDQVELSGSCNGLLCISDHQSNKDIFLFNPTIGSFRKLPFPDFDVPTIQTKCFTTVGFGYHHAEDDYKVIRCVYFYDKPFVDIDSYECEARVYSLNTDKWTKIGDLPFHLGYRAGVWLGNEFVVWKATRGFGRRVSFQIAAFDMDKQEFKEIPQPETSYSIETSTEVAMFGGYLSIFYLSRTEGVDIWSMKDNGEESWMLLYMIRRPHILDDHYMFLKPLCVLKKGEILMEAGDRARVLYDPKTHNFRLIHHIIGAPRRYLVTFCLGSLVSPVPNRGF